MYKISTELAHYKFNSITHKGMHNLTWFKMIDRVGSCLSEYEADLVMAYFKSRPTNFTNPIKQACTADDCPGCGVRPLKHAIRPSNLMLVKQPLLPTKGGEIFSCMYIVLQNAGGNADHNYNLPFDLIGMYND